MSDQIFSHYEREYNIYVWEWWNIWDKHCQINERPLSPSTYVGNHSHYTCYILYGFIDGKNEMKNLVFFQSGFKSRK